MDNNRINIAVICHIDPFGNNISGINTFIKGFIKFSPDNFDIIFIGISSDKIERPPGKWISAKIDKKDFKFLPVLFEKDENSKKVIPLTLRFIFKLLRTKINLQNRILLFNRIETAVLFYKRKNPKIGFIHNDIEKQLMKNSSENYWSFFPWLYRLYENFIFRRMVLICTVHQKTLGKYRDNYKKISDRFVFIPTWVDDTIFNPTDKPKEILKNLIVTDNNTTIIDKYWILFVGRLQEQKSPLRLINTFLEIYSKNNKCCLLIIGEGNYQKEIKELILKLKLEKSIFLLGYKNQAEIAQYYKAADVLLLVSNFEGMPRCVMEGLGSGLPVVSTDVGEVNKVIHSRYSGEIVSSYEPLEIAENVLKVLEQPYIYKSKNCVNAIISYTPKEILETLYINITKLSINNLGNEEVICTPQIKRINQ